MRFSLSRIRGWVAGMCLLCLISVLAAGCAERAPREPLRVGFVPWPPFLLFHLAHQEQMFRSDRIQLKEFGNIEAVMAALDEGHIDVVGLTSSLFVEKLAADPGLQVFLITDISAGGDALLAGPGIESLEDLRGKRVGLEPSNLGRFLLSRALQRAEMTMADIVPVFLKENEHVEAFEQGKVDAIVTYDPMRQKLRYDGAHILFDSSMIPGEIIDFMIVREAAARTHPEELRLLTRSFFDARQLFLDRPNVTAERLSRRVGISPEALIDTLNGIRLTSLEENRDMISGENPTMIESLQRAGRFLTQQGEIQEIPPFREALSPEFLPPRAGETAGGS